MVKRAFAKPSKEVGDYQTPALFEPAEKIFSAMIMFVMTSTNAGDQTSCMIQPALFEVAEHGRVVGCGTDSLDNCTA